MKLLKLAATILVSVSDATCTRKSVFTSVFFLSLVFPGPWAMVHLGKSTRGSFSG